jgi:ABC-type microcin C transport system duplicated ATPase subunit YejF
MQVVFQDPFASLSPRMTVGQIVGEGLALHRPDLPAGEREAQVLAMLDEVGLGGATACRACCSATRTSSRAASASASPSRAPWC